MTISCDCNYDDFASTYSLPKDFSPLLTKRSRKCCSCNAKLQPGETVVSFTRTRQPSNDIEERIYDNEVPLAPWFMCEECGGLYFALEDLGYCITLTKGENMKSIIRGLRHDHTKQS